MIPVSVCQSSHRDVPPLSPASPALRGLVLLALLPFASPLSAHITEKLLPVRLAVANRAIVQFYESPREFYLRQLDR